MYKYKIRTLCCAAMLLAVGFGSHQLRLNASANVASGRSAMLVQSGVRLDPVVTTGLTSPLYVTNARDNSNRLFIVEKPGRIKILQPGATTPTVFLDITTTGRVLSTGSEQGLLGLAFHPQFATNRRFFVHYTRQPDGAITIAEYRASATNPNVADLAETVLLTIPKPFTNHNGGSIEFGFDGFLYVGTGDGGGANDPGNRAQNINELLGKILRIDVNTPNGAIPYSSPQTNPFFGSIPGRDEIYALGLRNPYRFSFDRVTGDLYAGDVGQSQREEIDIITLGGNFGWRVFEGTVCTNLGPDPCDTSRYVFPVVEYAHTLGRCSVTGGYVYRGTQGTLPYGAYIYGDYCSGEIFIFQNGAQSVLIDTTLNIASFGEDEAGEIYVVALGGGVYRIANSSSLQPRVDTRDEVLTRNSNGTVTLTMTVINKGGAVATNVNVTDVTLNGVPGTPSPQNLGTLQPNQTRTVTLTFANPGTAGVDTLLSIRGTYAGGGSGVFFSDRKVTLP